MAVLVVILALVLLTAVIIVVASPLRAPRRGAHPESRTRADADDDELHELEARREAKYREIRDAELDFQTGKLSREDHAAIDVALRSEALAILDRLERLRAQPRAGSGGDAEAEGEGEGEREGEGPTPTGA